MRTTLIVMMTLLGSSCSAPGSCEAETACGCFARGAECKLVTEPCWCPSECNSNVMCVCGGGKFQRCETAR